MLIYFWYFSLHWIDGDVWGVYFFLLRVRDQLPGSFLGMVLLAVPRGGVNWRPLDQTWCTLGLP